MSCNHDWTERDERADGACSICQQAELDRLRAENAKLQKITGRQITAEFKARAEVDRLRERLRPKGLIVRVIDGAGHEIDRLRAELAAMIELNKANADGWAEAVELNRKALTPIEADRLRAENAELRKYARCHSTCASIIGMNEPCSCGFAKTADGR